MKDLQGKDIVVGATVCFPYQHGHWIGMRVGSVEAVREKSVTVGVTLETNKYNKRGTYSTPWNGIERVTVTRVDNIIVLQEAVG